MGDAEVAAVTREIRDHVYAVTDPLKRKFLLDDAARRGDALFLRAVLASPAAFPLYPGDDLAAATEKFVEVAQGDGAGVQSLRKSEAALAAFDQAFARAAKLAGSSIDVGQGPAGPTIRTIGADE